MLRCMELICVDREDMRCLILPARLRPVKVDLEGTFGIDLVPAFMIHILDVGMILIQEDHGIGQRFGLVIIRDDLRLRGGIDS